MPLLRMTASISGDIASMPAVLDAPGRCRVVERSLDCIAHDCPRAGRVVVDVGDRADLDAERAEQKAGRRNPLDEVPDDVACGPPLARRRVRPRTLGHGCDHVGQAGRHPAEPLSAVDHDAPGEGRDAPWSGRRDSNPRPSPWQGDALPAEPRPRLVGWKIAAQRRHPHPLQPRWSGGRRSTRNVKKPSSIAASASARMAKS
jgi:hypothetical protein